jgi:glyoxylate/hydroxypyruvate reductase A
VNLLFYTAAGNGGAWLDALSRALPEATVTVWPQTTVRSADYAIVWKPPQELLGALEEAKAVFNLGAGVDAIAETPELSPDLPLIRLEDAGMAEQMVEYACYAVLRFYREVDAYAEQQRAGLWRPRRRIEKRSFGIGVLGLGVMGAAVARALAGLGFPLFGWSRSHKTIAGVTSYAGPAELDAVLAQARVLICLLPSTRETRGLLDRTRLSRLPRGAFVVNLARGDILNDDDLVTLLDEGHLTAAILDVFRDEPLPATHVFWHHPKITVTPHVSAATLIDESVEQIATKIRRIEAGLPVAGVVRRERGY